MHLVYLIGEPGSGKSTAVRAALPELANDFGRLAEAPFEVWAGVVNGVMVYYLGNPRHPAFPGTDRLSMSVQPAALAWVAERATFPSVLVGEGDRLANVGFLVGARDAGALVTVVNCHTTLAERRRLERLQRLHLRAQSAGWVKGRQTKLSRLVVALAERAADPEDPGGLTFIPLDTSGPPADLGIRLRRLLVAP